LPEALRADTPVWVVFSTEYCAVCPAVVAEIETRRPGERVVVLDVAEHLDLASRYKVRRAPTVLRADADGVVVARLSGVDAVRAELAAAPAGV
jgi:thiol-disulfide isomerase/thioredoxin